MENLEQAVALAAETDDELEEGREGDGDSTAERETRKERRRNRVKEFEETARRAEERAARAEEQMSRMNATVNTLLQNQMQRDKQDKSVEDAETSLRREREDLWAQYGVLGDRATPEQAKMFLDKDRSYEDRILDAKLDKRMAAMPRAQTGSTLGQLMREANPDVFNHPRAGRYVVALSQAAAAAGDDATSPRALQAMISAARERFGINVSDQPSAAGRARMSGHGSMGGGGGATDDGPKIDFNNPGIKKLIDSYGRRRPGLTEDKYREEWLKGPGAALVKKK